MNNITFISVVALIVLNIMLIIKCASLAKYNNTMQHVYEMHVTSISKLNDAIELYDKLNNINDKIIENYEKMIETLKSDNSEEEVDETYED